MEAQELHRGRLIDHIQLVVRDLPASRRFYGAVFKSLGIPLAGEGDDYFWADELFISTPDSEAAAGELTGRHHIAFQAEYREMPGLNLTKLQMQRLWGLESFVCDALIDALVAARVLRRTVSGTYVAMER